MIKSLEELELHKTETIEEIEKILKEKIGLQLASCGEALNEALKKKADQLIPDIVNLAPYGDYDKLMEDPNEIFNFLQEEASKTENWKLSFIEQRKPEDQVMELIFENKAVDEGDTLKGFVYVGFSGTIRHAFVNAMT